MSDLALRKTLSATPDGSAKPSKPRLKLVAVAPDHRATSLRIAFHYLSVAAAALSAVGVLTWLAPDGGQRIPAFAALAAAASLFLLAAAPLAHRTWQRVTGVLIAATQLLLALGSQWEPGFMNWSLVWLTGGCLFMLQVSREHNWRSPGLFWFCSVLSAGLLAVNVLA